MFLSQKKNIFPNVFTTYYNMESLAHDLASEDNR